jgi:periplasmic protein TonB
LSFSMSLTLPKPSFFKANRNVVIAGSVLLFHALAIWALQTGLLMRAVEVIVPVEVLAQIIDLPTPKTALPVSTPTPPVPVKQAVAKPAPVTQTTPPILTANEPAPAATAFVASTPQPPAPIAPPSVSVAAVAAPAPPAPPKIVLPSSDADYLKNPRPNYPPMSNRMREQGTVLCNVLINVNGLPVKVELLKSSGYERLDESALATVMKWRYVPGKRNGVLEEMWYAVPVRFSLTGEL